MFRSRISRLSIVGISILMLSACHGPEENVGYDKHANARQGAILGGVVGAGIGAVITDDHGKGALIGSVVGAAGGAAIGGMLDQQEAELKERLDNKNVLIENTGEQLVLTIPQDILFDVDSVVVYPAIRDDILTVADVMQKHPESSVDVIGHADSTGTESYNQDLSERRADAVGVILREGGMEAERVITYGYGETRPAATNQTEEGKALNRRVEIVITPDNA